jgi:NAD(P) transhydrogenase beta subunit
VGVPVSSQRYRVERCGHAVVSCGDRAMARRGGMSGIAVISCRKSLSCGYSSFFQLLDRTGLLCVVSSRNTIVIERSKCEEFAGIEKALFCTDNTRMLYGDGREKANQIVSELKALDGSIEAFNIQGGA